MATKLCPYCAEEIQAEALKCKHCGTWLDPSAAPKGMTAGWGPVGFPAPVRSMVRPVGDRMLAGVCAGIGRALGMDPTLVRILYALGSFFTAIVPGILVYIILAFVIPSEDDPRPLR